MFFCYNLHMEKYGRLLKQAINAGRKRDYNESIRLLNRIISESDDFPQAYLYLGRSYHATGDYYKAVIFLSFFNKSKPESSAGNFFLGRAFLSAGLPEKALPHLTKAVKTSRNVKPLTLLGLTCLKLKRFDAAVDYLGQAVEREPENSRIYTGYLNALLIHGLRRFNAGDLDMASQILTFLANLDLNSVTVYLYLGKTLRELGKHSEAACYYKQASEP